MLSYHQPKLKSRYIPITKELFSFHYLQSLQITEYYTKSDFYIKKKKCPNKKIEMSQRT